MMILDIIASKNYIIYNKTLAKELGVESAIVFGVLCDYQRIFGQEEFYQEQDQICEDTGLTKYAVRSAVAKLKEIQLISAEVKGVPARYFYKINQEKLCEMLSFQFCENEKQVLRNQQTSFAKTKNKNCENDTTSSAENEKLNTREKETKREYITTNNIITNNIKENNINNNVKENTKENFTDKCKIVIDYLNEKTNKRYKYVESNFRFIKGRLNDGYTVEDLKGVIDRKVEEWTNTDMEKYIRPETLFNATKFENYVNEKNKIKDDVLEEYEKCLKGKILKF